MATSTQSSQISFSKCFAKIPDPRIRKSKIIHPLVNILFIVLCGTIAGANDFQAIHAFALARKEWLGKYIDLEDGIPSHDTMERVFSMLNPIAFQKCLLTWTQALSNHTKGRLISIDGKAVREAMARSEDKGTLCLVSAWASESHIFLGQVAGPKGSNELGAIPELLRILDLEGAIVTLDALSCQKEVVKQISEQGS